MPSEGDNADPDRSTLELKTLLRRLDPKSGSNHKDRVRHINRFRNYVGGKAAGGGLTTPEFYDDDLPLLMLGSDAPSAQLDDDIGASSLYGLLRGCGELSSDHGPHSLKRSARNAMGLLKYLVCDHRDFQNGTPVPLGKDPVTGKKELSVFARALCSCTIQQLRLMHLELHVREGKLADSRGGAREDACEVLVLLLTRHLSEDGERPEPVGLEDLLPDSHSGFDSWLKQNRDKQALVKKAMAEREGLAKKENAVSGSAVDSEPQDTNVLSAFKKKKEKTPEEVRADKHAEEQIEELGLDLYKPISDGGDGVDSGLPTRWADSQLSKEVIQMNSDAAERQSDREKADVDAERKRQEEERQKLIRRDPLSIRGEDFDLMAVQENREELLAEALADIDEAMEEEEEEEAAAAVENKGSAGNKGRGRKKEGELDRIVSLEAQREALESIVERIVGDEEDNQEKQDEEDDDAKRSKDNHNQDPSNRGNHELSILPTDPSFDPLLFLTLVHRNATFEELQQSIGSLNSKTDTQVQRLQDLVRDNFALFVRCVDGIDLFADGERNNSGNGGSAGIGGRLDSLDGLAESCSHQARRSFKPLLDNTNEVRKVQSALAVLQRVGPLLQIPHLMRQHIENRRFSSAVKAYRRVLVIDDDNKIELLRHVKLRAAEAAREARADLEATVASAAVPVATLLDAIRDLGELIELDVPPDPNEEAELQRDHSHGEEKESVPGYVVGPSVVGNDGTLAVSGAGRFSVGNQTVHVRRHPPALACLLLQAAHFSSLVEKSVRQADSSTQRIYAGESSMSVLSEGADDVAGGGETETPSSHADGGGERISDVASLRTSSTRGSGSNRWKYDILEARVVATIRAVAVARNWLPRLLRIGIAAREAERRRAARVGNRSFVHPFQDGVDNMLTSFEVFVTSITPSVNTLVEHTAFCALGCSNSSGQDQLKMSFGLSADERLQTLLRAPLPSSQSAKCASELADLVNIVQSAASSSVTLKPSDDDNDKDIFPSAATSDFEATSFESPLAECFALSEEASITLEKRRCIYAFDVCARTCALKASGSGHFDCDALLLCVQKLSEELTRPEQCANEIEKGCELVVKRCCDGLANYVQDRGDTARLRVVSECANSLTGRIVDVVREVSYLTNGQCESVEEALADDIMTLEGNMFEEFLDNVRRGVAGCARLGSLDLESDDVGYSNDGRLDAPSTFPSYLSACLLAIVRCRAQVERALGDATIRRSQGTTYQFLAMETAAEGVVDGICFELKERMSRLRSKKADRMANELQFLINTLKKYLSDEMLSLADKSRRMLLSKAGRGGEIQGSGPDGLAAIEELERLGRIYVLCLGE